MAEQWIQSNLNKYLIVRTTNVYGWDPQTKTPNFIMGLYQSVRQKKIFKAPSYLYGNPTYVYDLAEALIELHSKHAQGMFHIVGNSFVNRYEWAIKACEIFQFNCSFVEKIDSPPSKFIARPLKAELKSEKFRNNFNTKIQNLVSGLEKMKLDMKGLAVHNQMD